MTAAESVPISIAVIIPQNFCSDFSGTMRARGAVAVRKKRGEGGGTKSAPATRGPVGGIPCIIPISRTTPMYLLKYTEVLYSNVDLAGGGWVDLAALPMV